MRFRLRSESKKYILNDRITLKPIFSRTNVILLPIRVKLQCNKNANSLQFSKVLR